MYHTATIVIAEKDRPTDVHVFSNSHTAWASWEASRQAHSEKIVAQWTDCNSQGVISNGYFETSDGYSQQLKIT